MSEKFNNIIQGFENEIIKKRKELSRNAVNDDIELENCIISELCCFPDIAPNRIATAINSKYDMNITGDTVIRILRSKNVYLGNPEERAKLFRWADETSEYIKKAIVNGDAKALNTFDNIKFSELQMVGKASRQIHRILLLATLQKIPELNNSETFDIIISNFGTTYCKNAFITLIRMTRRTYNIPNPRPDSAERKSMNERREKLNDEKYILLTEENERVNQMLVDLQEEFNDRISEIKQQELTEFFSALNSEQYGYIIDELFMSKKGFNTLRKNNYELPSEINNIAIILSKFMQLIKDSGISPMIKPESIISVTPPDIENYYYEGTPFSSNNEVKKVLVVSPGWHWAEKDIIISRPRIKEIVDEGVI